MHRLCACWIFALVFVAVPVRQGASQSNQGHCSKLVVEVSGLRNSTGQLRAGLFASDDGFPLDVDEVEPVAQATIAERKGTLVFEDVPFGEYAVVVYHDEDADGELDTNWIGLPTEGAGVYKKVETRLPPPDFEDCKFRLAQKQRTLHISMNYRD